MSGATANETSANGATANGATANELAETLDVYVQLPTALRPGGIRQARVHVVGTEDGERAADAAIDDQTFEIELEILATSAARDSVSVTPTELTADRRNLHWTQIELKLADDVACETDLGELRVRVWDVDRGGSRGEVVVALPPVDCREGPPSIR